MNFKSTLKFLKDLKSNNNKEWFDKHKETYLEVKKDLEFFVQELINGIAVFDPQVRGLEVKKSVFRIYKDVRFSKDKTPYKVHLGAYMAEGGTKSPKGGYYIHIEPGNKSMLGGGIYMPEPPVLNAIRNEIDYAPKEFLKIINSKNFKNYFGGIGGEKLKNPPKGFGADHPQIELLKHKSFFVMHSISDAQLTAPDFKKNALKIFKEMKPLNDFLNGAMLE
jgi:uncharacterized protein (TIGR02453 family)